MSDAPQPRRRPPSLPLWFWLLLVAIAGIAFASIACRDVTIHKLAPVRLAGVVVVVIAFTAWGLSESIRGWRRRLRFEGWAAVFAVGPLAIVGLVLFEAFRWSLGQTDRHLPLEIYPLALVAAVLPIVVIATPFARSLARGPRRFGIGWRDAGIVVVALFMVNAMASPNVRVFRQDWPWNPTDGEETLDFGFYFQERNSGHLARNWYSQGGWLNVLEFDLDGDGNLDCSQLGLEVWRRDGKVRIKKGFTWVQADNFRCYDRDGHLSQLPD